MVVLVPILLIAGAVVGLGLAVYGATKDRTSLFFTGLLAAAGCFVVTLYLSGEEAWF